MLLARRGPSSFLGPVLSRGGCSTELCNENLTTQQAMSSKQELVNFVEATVRGVMDLENS